MNILIIGEGGREHALAWSIKQNPKCNKLFCTPGNPGIEDSAICVNIDVQKNCQVLKFCVDESVDFIVIGPEVPLANGLADDLRAAGFLTFGPSKKAAQLETSKTFTKKICDVCSIPTANYQNVFSKEAAHKYIELIGVPCVIKVDGLASGKGVTIVDTKETAFFEIEKIFNENDQSCEKSIIIEEFLEGEEASFFILTDGHTVLPIGSVQDHKRALDNDCGPNTGGMGAYSPAPIVTPEVEQLILATIIYPTIKKMREEGQRFQGVLYAGLMIKDGIPKLIEYNARFGDPECQVLAMRLGAQMLDLLIDCAESNLDNRTVNWAQDSALTIVMASKGYPGDYNKGQLIQGIENASKHKNVKIFHAGTTKIGDEFFSNGGRVLNITARGKTLQEAHLIAYNSAKLIEWPEGYYRNDIGWRGLKKILP